MRSRLMRYSKGQPGSKLLRAKFYYIESLGEVPSIA
jgi:hypothetical protein